MLAWLVLRRFQDPQKVGLKLNEMLNKFDLPLIGEPKSIVEGTLQVYLLSRPIR